MVLPKITFETMSPKSEVVVKFLCQCTEHSLPVSKVTKLMSLIRVPFIFLLGLFCRLVYLLTGLTLLVIGLATLWWMASGYLGFQAMETVVGAETYQVYLQPGPMLPMPWNYMNWSDWFWEIFRFGLLLRVALYATIATMFWGGIQFLICIPRIPYGCLPGETYTWDEVDEEFGGLKMAFAPAMLVLGVMGVTTLINLATISIAQLLLGEAASGDDWVMAMTIQTSLPYLGLLALIVYVALYAYTYGCLAFPAAIGITAVVVIRILAWLLGWFGMVDPETLFWLIVGPAALVACLGGVGAMFVSTPKPSWS